MGRDGWTDVLADLLRTTSDDLSTQQRARRGKAFERALWRTLDREGLAPRKGYRPRGEEIDGSFVLHGRTLLFEAKWTSGPPAASTFYEFKGKVDGKLVGTIGVFISMSGFSSDSVNALIAGKSINLVLVDGDDIALISEGSFTFEEAIDFKLRAATEEGTPFVPLSRGLSNTEEVAQQSYVVVESQRAVYLLTALMRAPLDERTPLYVPSNAQNVQFLVAFGRSNLTKVVGAYARDFDGIVSDEIIVADSDGQPADEVRAELLTRADYKPRRDSIFVLNPDIETVLGVQPEWLAEYLTTDQSIDEILNVDTVRKRLAHDPTLRKLVRRLKGMQSDSVGDKRS